MTLNGTGLDIAVVSSSGINFGSLPMGQTKSASLTFVNSGSESATSFAVVSSSIGAPFSVVSSNCGISLPAGSSCLVTVQFAPTTSGAQNAELEATFNSVAGRLRRLPY